MKLLDIAVKASEEKLRRVREVAMKSKKAGEAVLPAGWRRKELNMIMNDDFRRVWLDRKEKSAKKKDHLEKKHKKRKEENVFNGIPIGDQQTEAELGEDERGPGILGY